jgi:hypothetical protein
MDEPLSLRLPGESARMVVHPASDLYGNGYTRTFRIEIFDDGLSAVTDATATTFDDPSLTTYLQRLADDWRGWPGLRKWRTQDGELQLDAHHDGLGHVTLGVTLRNWRQAFGAPYPWKRPVDCGWSARAVFVLDAGEQMTQFAADIQALLHW